MDGKEKMYTPTEAAITNYISFGLDKKKEISHSVKKKKKNLLHDQLWACNPQLGLPKRSGCWLPGRPIFCSYTMKCRFLISQVWVVTSFEILGQKAADCFHLYLPPTFSAYIFKAKVLTSSFMYVQCAAPHTFNLILEIKLSFFFLNKCVHSVQCA